MIFAIFDLATIYLAAFKGRMDLLFCEIFCNNVILNMGAKWERDEANNRLTNSTQLPQLHSQDLLFTA
jgi:hypothetical protein